MQIDVLDYMLPPESFLINKHMASVQQGVNPIYTLWQPGWLWYMKAASGFPWDGNYYDDKYIYQCITEVSWTDPTNYKAFASKSYPGNHGGILWLPRYLTASAAPQFPVLITPDTTYLLYPGKGATPMQKSLGGPAVCNCYGPFTMDTGVFQGIDYIVQTYQWGPNLENMEKNIYLRGYGWVHWQLYTYQNGGYALAQESIFDQVTSGGTPALVFPNPLP